MSPAWVRSRPVKTSTRNPRGVTYQVLYRRGGRGYRIETAGTFKTLADARARRDLVAGWLAAGLNPKDEIARLAERPPARLTFADWFTPYERSRIDFEPATAANLSSILRRLRQHPIAGLPVEEVTVARLQELVADWSQTLQPASVGRYMVQVRLLLDFAGADPNPARSKSLRLPTVTRDEPTPPTADQFLALVDALPRRHRLLVVLLEQTAMRVGEACAIEWGDVDEQGCRLRLRAAGTKSRRARWVQVPEWLMGAVAATCPREDRVDGRRVCVGATPDAVGGAMVRACRAAGLPKFSPHDLRHRRLSIWHGAGVPAKQLAERAGHARASLTLDVYSHVMPLDEAATESLSRLLVMTR